MIMIYVNFVELLSLVLHTKFQVLEKNILRVLLFIFLVMLRGPFISTFVSTSYGCSICSLAFIGQADSEEKIFEMVDDDGRRTDAGAWTRNH